MNDGVFIIATPSETFEGERGGVRFRNGRAEVFDSALAHELVTRWGFKDITDQVRPKEKLLPDLTKITGRKNVQASSG